MQVEFRAGPEGGRASGNLPGSKQPAGKAMIRQLRGTDPDKRLTIKVETAQKGRRSVAATPVYKLFV